MIKHGTARLRIVTSTKSTLAGDAGIIRPLRPKYKKNRSVWVNIPTLFETADGIFPATMGLTDPNRKKQEAILRFGKRLGQVRRAKKLSLRKLAVRCNVDHSDIRKIEKGEVNITIATLMDLSSGLEVHPMELMNFDVEFLKDD